MNKSLKKSDIDQLVKLIEKADLVDLASISHLVEKATEKELARRLDFKKEQERNKREDDIEINGEIIHVTSFGDL